MLNFLNLFNFKRHINLGTWKVFVATIECVGWRRHSSLIFLILLFTKPNIEVSGWLYQTKTHITHIVYQPFSRVTPPHGRTKYGMATLFQIEHWTQSCHSILHYFMGITFHPVGFVRRFSKQSWSQEFFN